MTAQVLAEHRKRYRKSRHKPRTLTLEYFCLLLARAEGLGWDLDSIPLDWTVGQLEQKIEEGERKKLIAQ